MTDKQSALDESITHVLNVLRELESDNDETTNSTEDNLKYIIQGVIEVAYTSSNKDVYTALGVLNTISHDINTLWVR